MAYPQFRHTKDLAVELILPDATKRRNNTVGVKPKSQRTRGPMPHSGQGFWGVCCITTSPHFTTVSNTRIWHEGHNHHVFYHIAEKEQEPVPCRPGITRNDPHSLRGSAARCV